MFGANLVIKLKFVMGYRADKVKFTERRAGGRMERRTGAGK